MKPEFSDATQTSSHSRPHLVMASALRAQAKAEKRELDATIAKGKHVGVLGSALCDSGGRSRIGTGCGKG